MKGRTCSATLADVREARATQSELRPDTLVLQFNVLTQFDVAGKVHGQGVIVLLYALLHLHLFVYTVAEVFFQPLVANALASHPKGYPQQIRTISVTSNGVAIAKKSYARK